MKVLKFVESDLRITNNENSEVWVRLIIVVPEERHFVVDDRTTLFAKPIKWISLMSQDIPKVVGWK